MIVLLRGVNVGKAKRVPMAEFKAVLSELGCTDIRVLLNSGNAVVNAPRMATHTMARNIATSMEQRFGFDVPVVVKSAPELKKMVQLNALADAVSDPSRLLVVFAQRDKDLASLKALQALLADGEQLLVTDVAAYLHCPAGILVGRVGKAVLGKAGSGFTTRNWATVQKLQALAVSTTD